MKTTAPRHVGVIPDGNRRWAQSRGLPKGASYAHGIEPGLRLYELSRPAFRAAARLGVRFLPYSELAKHRESMARFGEGLKQALSEVI